MNASLQLYIFCAFCQHFSEDSLFIDNYKEIEIMMWPEDDPVKIESYQHCQNKN